MTDVGVARPFDYTSRDFESLSADLVTRMRTAIPEWTAYEQGFEKLLLDLFAYVGDSQHFYIDRMANEFFLQSAALRESVLNISQMFAYRPGAQTAAEVTLTVTRRSGITGGITLPKGTMVFAQGQGSAPIIFETIAEYTLPAASNTGTVVAREGVTKSDELVGTSSGLSQQVHVLYEPRVIEGSVQVFTREGAVDPATGLATLVQWTAFDRLIDADFNDRAFTLYVDEEGYTSIIFGDGVSGIIPAVGVPIISTYRYGKGVLGNVGAGTITKWYESSPATDKLSSVTNAEAAQGGTNVETMESMRTTIPRSLRAINRAVTLRDHADLALQFSGVAKANATGVVSTNVILYIAPTGGGQPSSNLIAQVQNFLVPNKVIAGTTVSIIGPLYVPVNISMDLAVSPQYRQDRVLDSITAALKKTFAFDNRQFGERITKSLVFQTVAFVPGVDYIDITAFNRDGSGFDADFTLSAREIASLGSVSYGAVTGGIQLT